MSVSSSAEGCLEMRIVDMTQKNMLVEAHCGVPKGFGGIWTPSRERLLIGHYTCSL